MGVVALGSVRSCAVTTTTIALSASDHWTLMSAPSTPTVRPLPARRPSIAVLKSPTTAPRTRGGARSWTRAWAIDANAMLNAPAITSSVTATG